jgi:predicted ATPase
MLSLPNDGRYPALELGPQQRRQKTLEVLTSQLHALAQARPTLMIFEDVHWIDPTSLDAVGRTVERLRAFDVLLIVTYRPEFEPPWIGRPHVTALTLNRLDEREISAVIDRVTGNKGLPASSKVCVPKAIERREQQQRVFRWLPEPFSLFVLAPQPPWFQARYTPLYASTGS